MKTYLLLALMQIAILPAFAQRGGHSGGGNSGGHSYNGSGGRFNGGGHSNGGGHYNGGPAASHSFGGRSFGHGDASRPQRNYGYAARPNYGGRGYGYGYHGYGHSYYGGERFGYHNAYFGYHHYAPGYFRNWEFGWGLGFWNPALYWQQSFYLNLYNGYDAGGYYAPGYFNGYVSDFNQVMRSINSQPNDDNKMTVAKEAIDYRNVSSNQVAEIMNSFASDQAKIDFAEYAYPHVTDKKNFYQVNNTFTNPESAQQLGGYLDSQYGSHASPQKPQAPQNNQQAPQNNQQPPQDDSY